MRMHILDLIIGYLLLMVATMVLLFSGFKLLVTEDPLWGITLMLSIKVFIDINFIEWKVKFQ